MTSSVAKLESRTNRSSGDEAASINENHEENDKANSSQGQDQRAGAVVGHRYGAQRLRKTWLNSQGEDTMQKWDAWVKKRNRRMKNNEVRKSINTW